MRIAFLAILVFIVACTSQPLDYCTQDADCVRQGSCCDCEVGQWVNKEHLKKVNCDSQCFCINYDAIGACRNNSCIGIPTEKEYLTLCHDDADCVRQPSCCDCGLGEYVNKQYYTDDLQCEQLCKCAIQESIGVCKNNHCIATPVTP